MQRTKLNEVSLITGLKRDWIIGMDHEMVLSNVLLCVNLVTNLLLACSDLYWPPLEVKGYMHIY